MDRDTSVIQQARTKLGDSSHLFLRHVTCRVDSGGLYLEGKVPSFYLKQTAQNLLQSIDGVERVVNRLEVVNAYGISYEDLRVKGESPA